MKKLLLCLFVLFSQVTHAADKWHTAEIKTVYPLADGNFYLLFKKDAPTCTNSNTPKYHHVSVGKNSVTAEGVKVMFTTALTAASLGKPITINFDDSGSGCYINRLRLSF